MILNSNMTKEKKTESNNWNDKCLWEI